jgi:rare lipoprotein A
VAAHAELSGGTAMPAEGVQAFSGPAGVASAGGLDALVEGATAAVASVLATGAGPDSAPATEIDRGKVSWYGGRFHGRRTASGEKFDMHEFTAAHKTLPFGTRVKVRDLVSGREVEVRINDRGPHVRGRVIDLSRAAALALGVLHAGEAAVALLLP